MPYLTDYGREVLGDLLPVSNLDDDLDPQSDQDYYRKVVYLDPDIRAFTGVDEDWKVHARRGQEGRRKYLAKRGRIGGLA